MSHRKFTKDILLIGLTNIAIALKGFIILPIITKRLGAEDYGIWAQLIVTISLITPMATMGLPYALVRFLDSGKKREEIQDGVYSVLCLVFLVGSTISLALTVFSDPISNFLGGNEPLLIKILVLATLFECLNLVFLNLFRALQEMGKYASLLVTQTLVEVLLITVAVLLNYGLIGAVTSLLAARVLVFVVGGTIVIKRIGIKRPKFSKLKEYLSFGLPTIPSNLSTWIVHSSNRYLIGTFLGTVYVGYYAPAHTTGSVINFFVAPLALVLPAVLSNFHDRGKTDKVKLYLKYSLKYFLAIAIPSAFGLSVLSKQLLTILSTPEIAERGYLVVPFIALSFLLWGIYSIFMQISVLSKKTQTIGIIWITTAALNLGLSLILIPRIGIIGAAVTTLLAYVLALVLIWRHSAKYLQFDTNKRFIVKSVLASATMSLLILQMNPCNLIELLIAATVGGLLYFFLMFLLKGFEEKEIKLLQSLLKRA